MTWWLDLTFDIWFASSYVGDFRKRRETSDALLEDEEQSEQQAAAAPIRSNGNVNWLASSKKEFRKEERTKERKQAKGKTGGSHLDSQRLIGGQEAIPHSWPWQVFVKIEGKSGGYDCGGSIIGTSVLETRVNIPWLVNYFHTNY